MFPPKPGRARTVNLILEVSSPGDTILCHCHTLPSGLHLDSRFWGSPPSNSKPRVCTLPVCEWSGRAFGKAALGSPSLKRFTSDPCPAGFLLNWPTLWGAIEIKRPLAGWLCNTRHAGPYLEHCCIPGLNEAIAEACGVFLEAISKQVLNFAKQPPKAK